MSASRGISRAVRHPPDGSAPPMDRWWTAVQHDGHCPQFCQGRKHPWVCRTAACSACPLSKVCAPGRTHAASGNLSWHRGLPGSWSCRKEWPPKNMYIIFSMQRSGSTTACNVINTLPNSICAFELLAAPPGSSQAIIDRYREDPESVLRESFYEQLRNYPKAPCAWGFKVFPEHVTSEAVKRLWGMARKVVILERRNISAQVQSLQRAHATGCWVGAGEDPSRCPHVQSHVSAADIYRHAQASHLWYSRQRDEANAHSAGTDSLLHVTTEDFLAMNHSQWRSLLGAFLLFCRPCWEQGRGGHSHVQAVWRRPMPPLPAPAPPTIAHTVARLMI